MTFTVAASANFVRIFCTDAPDGSEIRGKLDQSDVTRVSLFAGDSAEVWVFRPDVGGIYVLVAEEYTKGATSHGGGYLDDPDSYESETLLGSNTPSITVCDRLTADIGVQPDLATIVLFVHGSTIAKTLEAAHGEATPALIDPTTDKAKTAANSAAVRSAIATLTAGPMTISAAIGDPSDVIDDLIVNYEAHRVSATFHAAADTTNTVAASFRDPVSPAGVAKSANELRLKLTRHMNNDDDGDGLGTAAYHAPGGNARADQEHAVIVAGANEQDALSQCMMLADLSRAYEAHRVDTTYHDAADTTNNADSLPPLLEVYHQFLVALQSNSPTAPATSNAGTVLAVHSGGLKVS